MDAETSELLDAAIDVGIGIATILGQPDLPEADRAAIVAAYEAMERARDTDVEHESLRAALRNLLEVAADVGRRYVAARRRGAPR